ncbi:aminotransferase class I/II-fold pyridoxal phosphate-dependent enzyme [Micromonospora sp. NPDC023644]|uniref:aminotransferase class I/II-fold pyridoxal phosphate-dependent enzyme n=1 Tax=Micromonospora sp. NPDC023644 TaxID=3154321 RepID=UPI0034044A82
MSTADVWAGHLRPAVAALPLRIRPATAGWLNLKSNELLHPRVDELSAAYLRGCDAELVRRYPDQRALLTALAAYHGVDPAEVLLTAGSDTAIGLLVQAVGTVTGRLVVVEPDYEAWTEHGALHGVAVRPVAVGPEDAGSAVDLLLDALRAAPPSLVALSTPNGHSGQPVDVTELDRLAGEAADGGHVVVVDTCYHVFDPAGTRLIARLRRHRNVVVVNSYSKAFGLAGARLAAVVADPGVTSYLRHWRADGAVSALATGLLAARLGELPTMAGVWADVAAWRRAAAADIEARCPGWRCPDTAANFLTVDTGSEAAASAAVSALAGERIRARHLGGGPQWRTRLRLTVTPPPGLARAVEILSHTAALEV